MISVNVDPHGAVLSLNIDAPMASANIRALDRALDVGLARAGGLRGMMIEANPFPSWRDLSGLLDKLGGLRTYRDSLPRIAVVTESSPMEFAAQLAGYFPAAEIDRFSPQRMDRADAWVHGANAAEGDAIIVSQSAQTNRPVAEPDDEAVAAERQVPVMDIEDLQGGSGEEDDWFV